MWYLLGTDESARVRYNKLQEHVRASTSYLYAPEAIRFGVTLPPHYGDQWIEEEEVAREELHRLWHDSDAGLTVQLGVEWAHVAPTVVFKVLVSGNEPYVDLIADPSDIGVLRPDLHEWDRQEAIVHWYVLDRSAFRRMIAAIPDEKYRTTLMAEAEEHAGPGESPGSAETLPDAIHNIILAQATPNMIGVARAPADTSLAHPVVAEPVVKLAELWVRDDALDDWRVVTDFLATERIIWDPQNPLVSGEHPFHPLCLEPTPGYLWGVAPIERLLELQKWRERRMAQIEALMDIQLDPPLFFEGVSGLQDEKAKIFRKPGGLLSSPLPGAKVTPVVPPMPPDAFADVQEMDRQFASMGGLPLGMRGQTEPGVRSGEQALIQAILAAGPTLSKAMRVENCVEGIATAALRLQRRISKTTLRKGDGTEFLLAQMPGDFVARVSAHSASPIYAQQIAQKAQMAKQAGAISNEDYIRMLGLPQDDILAVKAKKLAQAQAERAKKLVEIKEREARAKEVKAERAK